MRPSWSLTLISLLLFAGAFLLPGLAHAQFAADTFAGTSGKSLSGQSLSTGGGTWVLAASGEQFNYSGSNSAEQSAPGGGVWCEATASNTPPSNYSVVKGTFIVNTANTYGTFLLVDRSSNVTSANNSGYYAGYSSAYGGGQGAWGIFGGGSSATWGTSLGSSFQVSAGAVPTGSYTVTLTDAPNGSNDTLTMTVQRASDGDYLTSSGTWQSGSTNCASGTTSSVSTASPGKVGFWMYNNSEASGPSTGVMMSSWSATNYGATSYTSSESASTGATGTPVTLTYTGNGPTTATVTPSVSGVSGSFSPTSIALNNTTAVTLTFTPSTTGTATLSSTNNGGLTNPGNLSYTVTSGPATSYTQSLSASSGPIGTAVTITYQANGTSTATITPAVSGVSGTFSPTTINLNGATPVTVTFTPSANGTATLTATNSGSLTNPSSQNYLVDSATSYTSSESATSGANTVPVTLTYTANGYGTQTVTPAVSGVSGTFSPTTIALNNTTGVTVTFTPSTIGTATFSSTNSGSLSNPSNLTYVVNSGPQTVGVTNAAWFFSPGAWVGNSGRGGSTYRQTSEQGNYARFYFTSSTSSPTCSITFDCTMYSGLSAAPQISYSVDGTFTDNITLSTSGSDVVSLSVSGAGSHIVTIYLRNLGQFAGWEGTAASDNNVYRIDNAIIDANSTATAAPTFTGNGNWIWIIGPSTCAGTYSNAGYDDSLLSYSHLEGEAFRSLGYEYCVKAFGYWGVLASGDNDNSVPPFYPVTGSSGGTGGTLGNCSWNKIDPNNSQLDSGNYISAYGSTNQQPFLIQMNFGGNEARIGSTASDVEASVTQAIVALRAAAPSAWILVGPEEEMASTTAGAAYPTYLTYVDTGVTNYLSAHPSDTKTKLIDFTSFLSSVIMSGFYSNSPPHPNGYGHALVASATMSWIEKNITSAATTTYGRGRTLK